MDDVWKRQLAEFRRLFAAFDKETQAAITETMKSMLAEERRASNAR